MRARRPRQSGFSMIELVVVVAIILIVTAVAMPNMVNAIYNIRLRSSASTMAGMMQTARSMAVRDNTAYFVRTAKLPGGSTIVWVSNSKISPTITDPQAQLSGNVTVVTSGWPGAPNPGPTMTGSVQPPSVVPGFNSRGLPCITKGSRCINQYTAGSGVLMVQFQTYLTDTRPLGSNGWTAITVTPSARIQTWMYDGANWGR